MNYTKMNYTKINYTQVETMAFQLSLQLQALEEKGFGVLYLQPSNITMVDEGEGEGKKNKYLLMHLDQCLPLQKKNASSISINYLPTAPFPKDCCAPELLQMNALPCIVNKSVSYYSLGLLCLNALGCSTLDELRGTKLFYFLERCMKENPSDRINLHF